MFVVPADIPYNILERVAQNHHTRLAEQWYHEAPEDPTDEDLSMFLLCGQGSVIPACMSINSMYVKPLSQSAAELIVNLPTRGQDDFEELLEDAVIAYCQNKNRLPPDYIRPMYFNRPVTVSHRHYGAFVGPRGQRIIRACNGRGKLLWSTTAGHALQGEFTLWIPDRELKTLKNQIYETYKDVID